jgi:hypothetical protein
MSLSSTATTFTAAQGELQTPEAKRTQAIAAFYAELERCRSFETIKLTPYRPVTTPETKSFDSAPPKLTNKNPSPKALEIEFKGTENREIETKWTAVEAEVKKAKKQEPRNENPPKQKTFFDRARVIALIAIGTIIASFYGSQRLKRAASAGGETQQPKVSAAALTPQANTSPSADKKSETDPQSKAVKGASEQRTPAPTLGPVTAPVTTSEPLAFLASAVSFSNEKTAAPVRAPLLRPAPPAVTPKGSETALAAAPKAAASSSQSPSSTATPSTASSSTAPQAPAVNPSTNGVAAAAGPVSEAATSAASPNPFVNLSKAELAELISVYSSRGHQELKLTTESEEGFIRGVELAKKDGIDLIRAAVEYKKLLAADKGPPPKAEATPLPAAANAASATSSGSAAAPTSAAATVQAATPAKNPYESLSAPELEAMLTKYGSLAHQQLKLTTESEVGWKHACELAAKEKVDLKLVAEALTKARQREPKAGATTLAPLRVAVNLEKMSAPELSALLQSYRTRAMNELNVKEESQATWDRATKLAEDDGIRLDQLIDRVNQTSNKQSSSAKAPAAGSSNVLPKAATVTSVAAKPRGELNHKAVLNDFGRNTGSTLRVGTSAIANTPAKMSTAQLHAAVTQYGICARETIQAEKGADYEVSFDEAMDVGSRLAAKDGVDLAACYKEYMARPDRGAAQAADPKTVAADAVRADVAGNARSLEKKIRMQTPEVETAPPDTEQQEIYTSYSLGRRREALVVENSVVGMRRERKFLWLFPMKDKVTVRPGMTKAEFESRLAWLKQSAHEFNVKAGLASPQPLQMQVNQQPTKPVGSGFTISENQQTGTPGRNG